MLTDVPVHLNGGIENQTALKGDSRVSAKRKVSKRPPRMNGSPDGDWTQERLLSGGMGWLGFGLGLAEVLAPKQVADAIGVSPQHRSLIRWMGLRELASSAGVLSNTSAAAPVFLRVAGDVVDLALLGAAFTSRRSNRSRLIAITAAVSAAMAVDLIAALQLARNVQTRHGAISVKQTIVINRSPSELYQYWRNLTHLPQFMKHLHHIDLVDDKRSHWVAAGPADTTIEWDAIITEDSTDECIAWRSVEGAAVEHLGSVQFGAAIGNRGTLVQVEMNYRPPLGTLGAALVAALGRDPKQTIHHDLKRFKQLMETGEIITTQGQSAARKESTSWKFDRAVR